MGGWELLALAGALCASFFFSGIETGFYSINKLRLRLRLEEGDRHARRVWAQLSRNSWLLSVILLGNNAFNYLATDLGLGLLAAAFPAVPAELLGTLAMTPVLFFLGEVIPKVLFRAYAERLTYPLSLGVTWAGVLFWPLVLLLRWPAELASRLARGGGVLKPLAGREGLRALFGESSEAGVLSRVQAELAGRLLDLQAARIQEVMVPLKAIVAVPEELPREEFLDRARAVPFTRFPVYRSGRPGEFLGFVQLLDLLYDQRPGLPVRGHLRRLDRLPSNLPADRALRLLQRRRQGMALVEGGRGQVLGLVTLTDLVAVALPPALPGGRGEILGSERLSLGGSTSL